MLIEMPRKPSARPGASEALDQDRFEAGLRRDLSGAALVSYNPATGGLIKRAFDLLALAFFAPVWAPLLALHWWQAKRRGTPAFVAREVVGYGARVFRCFGADRAVDSDDTARAKRQALWARLPELWSVLKGDMSLVGPLPLTPEDVASLRTGLRHYLSMRPGMFSIAAIADAESEDQVHYKAYAMSWSLLADAMILWQELSGLWREE
jgi:lipopolysaccharide/colanic/teichoic acid biosynthesis glycosyltransferase